MALSLSPGSSHAADDLSATLPRPGDYVSSEYLQRLKTTKSPLLAEENRDINVVEVRQAQRDAVSITPILHFHEGGPEFQLSKSGQVLITNSAGLDMGRIVLRAESPDRLFFGFGNRAASRFVRILDFDDRLRDIVIAGKYFDELGGRFEFTKAGTAYTPEGSFPYIVGVEHGPYHFDYIVDTRSHTVFKLVRNGCTLDLLKVLDAIENEHGNRGTNATLWHSLRRQQCTESSSAEMGHH
jgi:hypothetical protein